MAEVDIYIKRKRGGGANGGRVHHGPQGQRREPEYLPRRKAGFLNFYDLGQIKSGADWIDLPFNVNPGFSATVVSGHTVTDFSPFTLTNWESLYTLIAAVPHADWKDQYRKLEFGESGKYGVSEYQGRGGILLDSSNVDPANKLQASNPEWLATGLKPLQDWIEVFPTGGLSMIYKTADTTNYKVTDTHDYAAPAVTLKIKRGANVFLMPLVMYTLAVQEVGIDAAFRGATLYSHWTIKPRALLLDKTLKKWFDPPFDEVPILEGYYLASTSYRSSGAWMFDASHIGDAFATAYINWMKAQPQAQLWVQRGTAGSGGATFAFEPLANFPFPATGPQSVVNVHIFHTQSPQFEGLPDIGDDADRYEGEGLLLGVIQQGSKFYYIWAKNNTQQITFWDTLTLVTSAEI